jgi:L-alanine-DL-glutamate epimerase-like enolase superfamily enzyme
MNRKRDVYYWQERSITKYLKNEWVEHAVFKIDSNGVEGIGAGTPNPDYGETYKTTMAIIEKMRKLTENWTDLNDYAEFEKEMNNIVKFDMSSKTAVEIAIADYILNSKELDLSKILFSKNYINESMKKIYVFNDMDYDVFEEIGDSKIKIEFLEKLNNEEIKKLKEKIEKYNVWIDFKGIFNHFELKKILDSFKSINIIAIEQPLPVGNEYAIKDLLYKYPVFWDESFKNISDVIRLREYSTGLVFELTKFGGLMKTAEYLNFVRDIGLETMISSRIEHPITLNWSKKIMNSFDYIDLDYDHYIIKTSK